MARTIITGWAETKTLPSGKQVTEVSGNQAPRAKNKDTGDWEQVGDPLYIRATFWDDEALWVAQAAQGNRVTVEGELVARDYQTKDGHPGKALELRWPKFLGVIPSKHAANPNQAPARTAAQPNPVPGAPATPETAANDPWGNGATNTAPF